MTIFDVLDTVAKYKKIIAWGAGRFFEKYHNLLEREPVYIVDRNPKLWGEKKKGIEIRSPETLKGEVGKEDYLIVVFNAHFEEIVNNAREIGAFDIIDITMLEILSEHFREQKNIFIGPNNVSCPVLVCAGIHALWGINGSRKFIEAQNDIIHRKGIETLEVAPLLYYKECDRENPFLVISVSGKYHGIYTLKQFLKRDIEVIGVIIHSLYYNHNMLWTLLGRLKIQKSILYYLHDYYCICENRFLYYKNNACINCAGKFNCAECDFEGKRKEMFIFHKRLFDTYSVKLIAPSKDTAARIKQFYTNEVVVIPHLYYKEVERDSTQKNMKRIAYIGGAFWLKGWNGYKQIVKVLRGKYEFYCFGECIDKDYMEGITYVNISLGESENTLNMTEALKKYKIDLVYLGAIWPETFSYTYYEAYEAGCFVLTNKLSGNIYDQVKQNGNGLVFESLDETIKWLEDRENVTEAVTNMCKRIVDVRADDTFMAYFC